MRMSSWIAAIGLATLPKLASAKCDVTQILDSQRNLATADVALHPRLAAQTLVRACTWTGPVQAGLAELQGTPSGGLRALDRKVAVAEPDLWKSACPGGLSTLQGALALGPAEAHARIYAECELSRFGVATAEEFGAAPGSLVFPVLVAQSLKAEGVDPGLIRDMVRALSGIAPPWATAP